MPPEAPGLDRLQLYDVDDVATVLRRSKSFVYGLCRERRIPHRRVGGAIRFSYDDMQQIVGQGYRAPVTR